VTNDLDKIWEINKTVAKGRKHLPKAPMDCNPAFIAMWHKKFEELKTRFLELNKLERRTVQQDDERQKLMIAMLDFDSEKKGNFQSRSDPRPISEVIAQIEAQIWERENGPSKT